MIKITNTQKNVIAGVLATLLLSPASQAAVSADEAAKLGNDLTPFGAEKAGNAEGTIPTWQGGITEAPAGFQSGQPRLDPFAEDQVLYTITAANYQQYTDQLTEGQKALFEKFPDSFNMPVYPTRRSFSAPEWVYDNTASNAESAQLAEGGNGVTGAFGGIPFPLPQNGLEVMWNHQLRWQGEGDFRDYVTYIVYGNGVVAGNGGKIWTKYPYYDRSGGAEGFNGNMLQLLIEYGDPARRKGEMILVKDPLNQVDTPRQAWQYIPGQRRVRRAPTIAYDTPNLSGVNTYDDAYMFNGAPDRFEWKLVGKKEILIPYNNYKFMGALSKGVGQSEVLPAGHPNPEFQRWELHRVWVVESTLKDDKRHVYGKRVFYIDEDSWGVAFVDKYDNRGTLWRTAWPHIVNAYELPGTVLRNFVYIDLLSGTYAVSEYVQEASFDDVKPDSLFTAAGVRKKGLR